MPSLPTDRVLNLWSDDDKGRSKPYWYCLFGRCQNTEILLPVADAEITIANHRCLFRRHITTDVSSSIVYPIMRQFLLVQRSHILQFTLEKSRISQIDPTP